MKLTVLPILAVLILGVVSGCGPKRDQQTYQSAQTFSGTLRNVKQLVGGATSGWELHIPTGAARTPEVLPLDVSEVESDAMTLEGQSVMIKVRGRLDGAYVVQSMRRVGQ